MCYSDMAKRSKVVHFVLEGEVICGKTFTAIFDYKEWWTDDRTKVTCIDCLIAMKEAWWTAARDVRRQA